MTIIEKKSEWALWGSGLYTTLPGLHSALCDSVSCKDFSHVFFLKEFRLVILFYHNSAYIFWSTLLHLWLRCFHTTEFPCRFFFNKICWQAFLMYYVNIINYLIFFKQWKKESWIKQLVSQIYLFFSTLHFHACLCHIEESFACDCLHADQINNVASDNL